MEQAMDLAGVGYVTRLREDGSVGKFDPQPGGGSLYIGRRTSAQGDVRTRGQEAARYFTPETLACPGDDRTLTRERGATHDFFSRNSSRDGQSCQRFSVRSFAPRGAGSCDR